MLPSVFLSQSTALTSNTTSCNKCGLKNSDMVEVLELLDGQSQTCMDHDSSNFKQPKWEKPFILLLLLFFIIIIFSLQYAVVNFWGGRKISVWKCFTRAGSFPKFSRLRGLTWHLLKVLHKIVVLYWRWKSPDTFFFLGVKGKMTFRTFWK